MILNRYIIIILVFRVPPLQVPRVLSCSEIQILHRFSRPLRCFLCVLLNASDGVSHFKLSHPLPASFVCGFFSNHSAHRVHSCWKLLLRLWAPEVCVFSQFPVGSEQKSLKETTIGQDFSVARSLPLSVVRDCLEV